MPTKTIVIALVISLILLPLPTFADIGVGVGTGKIVMNEPLKPGLGYVLPALPVLNTGDTPSQFKISIEYLTDQSQLTPPQEWFAIDPASFDLEPQQSKLIALKLSLPAKARPGDYFAYVQASPVARDVAGQSSVGVAAAAKLYFTIAPANIFQAAYYMTAAFIGRYAPWTDMLFVVMGAAIAFRLLNRYVSLNIGIRRKQ